MGSLKPNTRIGIVGLGTIGTQELALWQRAGHPTVGYDVSSARVKAAKGTDRFADLSAADVLILSLPNLGPNLELSMGAFDRFVDDIQTIEPNPNRLIIVASTVPIGFTRELGHRIGAHGRLLAHVPERFDPGRSTELGEIPRVAGATTKEALDLTVELYTGIGVTVRAVDPVEVAEASKLLENAFRLVNIAFINEFAELCRRLGIVAADVIDAAATKPFAFMAHQPGVGAGGSCIPTMPQYLLQAAREAGFKMPLLQDAVDGNEQTVARVSDYLSSLLQGGEIEEARVLVVGASYKPNYPDARGSAAVRFATGLAAHHQVEIFDPIVDADGIPKGVALKREIPRQEKFDAVVIAVKHKHTDMDALRKLSPILIDLIRGSVEVTESISTRP